MNDLPSPDIVFHYTSLCKALKILGTQELFVGPLEGTNDPYEWTEEVPRGSMMYLPKDESKAMVCMDNVGSDWCQIRKRFQVFCTYSEVASEGSTDSTLRDGRTNSAMWAYYGKNHRGVCLVLSRSELTTAFRAHSENYLEGPVEYTPFDKAKWSEAHSVLGAVNLDALEGEIAREHVRAHKAQLLFRKSPEWLHENEWRWVVDSWIAGKVKIPIKGAIVEVIAGLRNTKSQCLLSAIANMGGKVPLKHAIWNSECGKLEVKE